MRRITRRTGLFASLLLPLIAAGSAVPAQSSDPVDRDTRILSIGGSVTEIVHALGAGDLLVARDSTSSYPASVTDLPDVGYMRALSPEGVLSVDPDLILAEADAGPPEAIDVLEAAGIPMVTIPDAMDRAGLLAKVEAVGAALDLEEEAEALSQEIGARLDAALERAETDTPARVLFVLSSENGRIMASGTGTAADGIIALAGATNAVTAFAGYKTLTDEAVAEAAPDVVLMMEGRGGHGSDDAVLKLPAFAGTPAARDGAIVRMDGLLLLGFGPRTPEAVERLSDAIAQVRGDDG
ncbi:hemin ABC transporter substrate-binding protein [Salipiger sp. IMCC34102]|uniref:heme/hemin ABC transporter substrate-binding protein n=1 Tax=Salipiger sp. IMCC34102 TaxID=2510647 RepID=UPI00101D6F59|nr:ABC transporter substrate-binding protein [Salipiger sp. IMCC34102]RYH04470.1 hemin ABC transporter substrate-binding protein [Salipiger sp. IMCC34102]